jgi:LacI family transcriptional regulator
MILHGQYTESWGYEAAHKLMSLELRPDALFAANNSLALGILEALHTLGLRVPEDVAVVCFDDTTNLVSARFLTTASQPAQEMGRVATRLLLERLVAPERASQHIILPIEIVIRSSCGCSAGDGENNLERTGSLPVPAGALPVELTAGSGSEGSYGQR